ncbi:MAG: rubrerythrin family protein [Sporomusaceae bacterium]|nr:rubrerythrin family protein [Sporomusaceae bacterium]
METIDVRTALRTTLTQKQELVRDYQSFAETINNEKVAALYREFAEQEGYAAATIKDELDKLSQ